MVAHRFRSAVESLVEESRESSRPCRANPCLTLPDAEGGGKVYKRTVVAELNKLRPGQRLARDRLAKVKQASRRMDQAESARATSSSENATQSHVEGEEEVVRDPSEGKVGVGSDFGMAFSGGSESK